MGRRVNVIGVGMTKFAKPGASEEYNVMASKAAKAALEDAKIPYDKVVGRAFIIIWPPSRVGFIRSS